MELGGTTSISQLPISYQTEQNNSIVQNTRENNNREQNTIYDADNIKINVSQNQNQREDLDKKSDPSLLQKTYNQLVSGIQQASASGHTVLPSRDIPQDTLPIMHDESIKPNFIPENNNDYIDDYESKDRIIENHRQSQTTLDSLELFYQEFQLPLLIAILYFLFQLPVVQKHLYKIIPSLFKADGNPNLYGYVFNSIAFGLSYLVLLKILKYFSNLGD